jgi:hypothetical protein
MKSARWLLLLVAFLGTPAGATAQPAGADSVSGTAAACLFVTPGVPNSCAYGFSFSAQVQSGPGGEHPSGDLSWYVNGTTPGGSSGSNAAPTCLHVNGRVAIIGVSGQEVRGGISNGVYSFAGLVRVVDAGGPASGADSVAIAIQRGAKYGPPLPGPTSCSSFPGGFPPGGYFAPDATNETGDLVVSDRPASKDDCKGSGWKVFRIFKNQGACVSFVATGGKNAPS